jgi:hypothetical protein
LTNTAPIIRARAAVSRRSAASIAPRCERLASMTIIVPSTAAESLGASAKPSTGGLSMITWS